MGDQATRGQEVEINKAVLTRSNSDRRDETLNKKNTRGTREGTGQKQVQERGESLLTNVRGKGQCRGKPGGQVQGGILRGGVAKESRGSCTGQRVTQEEEAVVGWETRL